MSNRRQVALFVVLTVILTIASVWGARLWLKHSETLTFAVGEPNGVEAQFANKLANVLKINSSRLRLNVVSSPDNAKALAQFDRRQADLAVLRTDAKIPGRARAIAILEHDVLLLISPKSKKIKSLAALKKLKIALINSSPGDETFIRKTMEPFDDTAGPKLQVVPADATLDKLFGSGGYGGVVAIAHTSKILKDKSYERYARLAGGFTLNAIDEAKAIARKIPGISAESLETGMLSSAPAIPDDDLDTIGLQWILAAQSKLSSGSAGELARIIYENKSELALDGFAAKIEPAETDKDAFIIAHPGAAQYINDDTKSFMDRYSDVLYLGGAALSIIGSIFAGLYAKVTRIAPEKAGELSTAILDIGERIEHATSLDALETLQDELESILRSAVIGLRDGTISRDGLDTFRLGYEFVRDEIQMRRESLKRHSGHVDPVIVKAS